jgi:hypothetical protein
MSFFRRPDYRSDTTNFINDLKKQKPELPAQQVAGRALLWDKSLDRTAQAEWLEAQVPQQAYVYQTKTTP